MVRLGYSRNRIEGLMSHDPALEAHEHAEHAEHAAPEANPFISRVSITVAVLAVMAAAAGSLETVEGGRAITESGEAVLAQDQATDAWNEYQAASLKRHMYDIAVDNGGTQSQEYKTDSSDQRTARYRCPKGAEQGEKGRDAHTASRCQAVEC